MTTYDDVVKEAKDRITCDDCGGLWVKDKDGVYRANHSHAHHQHLNDLHAYHFCLNDDDFLNEDGRNVLYKLESHERRAKLILADLPATTTLDKRLQRKRELETYKQELIEQLEAARVEARKGRLFYDTELKRAHCPGCGTGILNIGVHECYVCEGKYHFSQMEELEVFDSPFDDVGEKIHVCTELREDNNQICRFYLTSSGWSDFHYQKCSGCERIIMVRCGKNGYHTHFRVSTDGMVHTCLQCYERNILVKGVDKEALKRGELPGMFFSGDNREPLNAGFVCVEDNVFIGGAKDAKVLADKALERVKLGHTVVFGYERMATLGGEGYVSMWVKMPRGTVGATSVG